MIPDWMNATEAGPYQGAASLAKKKGFAKKTVDGVLAFFQESLISETFAKRKGLLQSLDPRVKLISMLVLIVGVTLMRSPWVLLIIYLLTLVLAYFSKIEVLWFVKRVWVFIPIFAGVIVIPILFNVFLAGDVLVPIATLGNGSHLGPIALPSSIYITRQGTTYVVTFILRVAACVSLAILLFLTTQRDLLFKSMRTLYVPKVYVLTISMCYRYIFLLLDTIADLFTARRSRQIVSLPLREEQRWVGGRVGYMLVKSLDMSDKVHEAMISRGFNGDVKLMHDNVMHHRDYVAIVTVLACCVILALISRSIISI
jgi:cobalt/nickel transport system permease protein